MLLEPDIWDDADLPMPRLSVMGNGLGARIEWTPTDGWWPPPLDMDLVDEAMRALRAHHRLAEEATREKTAFDFAVNSLWAQGHALSRLQRLFGIGRRQLLSAIKDGRGTAAQ